MGLTPHGGFPTAPSPGQQCRGRHLKGTAMRPQSFSSDAEATNTGCKLPEP